MIAECRQKKEFFCSITPVAHNQDSGQNQKDEEQKVRDKSHRSRQFNRDCDKVSSSFQYKSPLHLRVMKISSAYKTIRDEVAAKKATLVAVVKKRTIPQIQTLIDEGAADIGFGTVQDAEDKLVQLHFNGKVHLVGHLQKNKVRKAILLFDMIQSIDSLALAERISQVAAEMERTVSLLLQVNIADDSHKFGFSLAELHSALPRLAALPQLDIRGLMMIGKADVSEESTRQDFVQCRQLFTEIRDTNIFGKIFTDLSMGMSDDYPLALAEGATMVRVGSALFA